MPKEFVFIMPDSTGLTMLVSDSAITPSKDDEIEIKNQLFIVEKRKMTITSNDNSVTSSWCFYLAATEH